MSEEKIRCIECRKEYSSNDILYSCPSCHNLLEVILPLSDLDPLKLRAALNKRPMGVWKYKELLPKMGKQSIISMNEGGTPLHRCHRLGDELGIRNLYMKFDGMNPTGSFKDRGMTVGISKAFDLKTQAVACASTGNTSASLAAYAGLARMRCIVLIPSGRIALGKLSQAMMHGATVLAIRGNFDDAMAFVMKASEALNLYVLNSVNPFRLEGQKSAAFEICDQLGSPPEILVIPVGNGGNSAAYWKGFSEFMEVGLVDSRPQIFGIQADGAAPVARAFERGEDEIEPVSEPETVATAIRIGNPANWKKTIRAIRSSGGTSISVPDSDIIDAQKKIARTEGLFVEPAAASSLAGLIKLVETGKIDRDQKIVCVATGHGLKDPDSAIRNSEKPIEIGLSIEGLKAVLRK